MLYLFYSMKMILFHRLFLSSTFGLVYGLAAYYGIGECYTSMSDGVLWSVLIFGCGTVVAVLAVLLALLSTIYHATIKGDFDV